MAGLYHGWSFVIDAAPPSSVFKGTGVYFLIVQYTLRRLLPGFGCISCKIYEFYIHGSGLAFGFLAMPVFNEETDVSTGSSAFSHFDSMSVGLLGKGANNRRRCDEAEESGRGRGPHGFYFVVTAFSSH